MGAGQEVVLAAGVATRDADAAADDAADDKVR